jgi:hypothetical protein
VPQQALAGPETDVDPTRCGTAEQLVQIERGVVDRHAVAWVQALQRIALRVGQPAVAGDEAADVTAWRCRLPVVAGPGQKKMPSIGEEAVA